MGLSGQGGGAISSVVLPLAAGVLAAAHPAGARGLAGLTSAVQLQALNRERQREEENRQALLRFGQLFSEQLGREAVPAQPARLTEALSPGEDPEAAAFLERQPAQPALRLSDVLGLGPEQTELYRQMLAVPQFIPGAASALLQRMAPQEFTLGEGQRRFVRTPRGEVREIAAGPPQFRTPLTIQTIDDQGRPVTRVLTPEEAVGQTFPGAPSPNRFAITDLRTDQGVRRVRIDRVTGEVVQDLGAAPQRPPSDDRNAVAQELFGREFADLTQPQQAQVNRVVQARRVEVSAQQGAAGVVAKTTAERALPLGAERAANFIHPVTGQLAPPTMSETEAIAAGFRFVEPKQRQELADLDNTRVIVEQLRQLSDALITADTPVQAATQAARLTAGAVAKTNPLAATYRDQQQAFLGILSRSLGGERGVLTDRDIGRIANSLPGFGDTKAIKDAKLNLLGVLLDTATQAKRAAIFGEPPGQGIKEKVAAIVRDLERAASGGRPAVAPTTPPRSQLPESGVEKIARARPIVEQVRSGTITRAQARERLVREAGFRADEADGFLDTVLRHGQQ